MYIWKKITPLLVCVFGELMMLTECKNCFGPFISPLLHFVFSAGSGLFLLILGWNVKVLELMPRNYTNISYSPIKSKSWLYLLFLVPITYVVVQLNSMFAEMPIDMNDPYKSGSDIIPALMFYVKRFVSGEFPYTPMRGTHWLHTVIPNYFTFQWLPYCLAELARVDYRWVPPLFLLIAFGIHYSKVHKTPMAKSFRILLIILPILIFGLWFRNSPGDFHTTVEGLIVAYYLMFAYSLYSKKIIWIAIPLALCLLSRYSLIIWTPLFFLICLTEKGFKNTLILGLLVLAGFAIFYGPFLLKDPTILTNGFEYYTYAAGGEWRIHDWQPKDAQYPFHLERGTGFAIYFYKYCSGDVSQKLAFLRYTHLAILLLVVCIMSILWWVRRNKTNAIVFATGSFKIYLAFFYGFLQVPYNYLNILPLMMTLPLLYTAIRCINQIQTNRNIGIGN